MSKRARSNGSRAIERRLAQGRGQGRGATYKPWLMIHDVASHGLSTRMKSPLNGRTYHLLSQLETNWLYALHALPNLVDIREQYPLLELEETLEIAAQLGVAHPTDPLSKESCVSTTDFVLTLRDGPHELDMAIAIKPSADLASSRTLEKLEIERVYWSARHIEWHILTETELPRALVKNMQWVHGRVDLAGLADSVAEQIPRIRAAMDAAVHKETNSLADIAMTCDERLGLKAGSALSVARHLIGSGAWAVDLTVEIDPRKPLHLVQKESSYGIACKLAA